MTDDTHPLIKRLRDLEPYSDMWQSVRYQLKAEDPLVYHDWNEDEWKPQQQELWQETLQNAWEFHERRMVEDYGRRDPECVWCGETVYMTYQGLVSGGIWTTVEADEFHGDLNGPGTRCAKSSDGQHSCLPTEKLAQKRLEWQTLREIERASEDV